MESLDRLFMGDQQGLAASIPQQIVWEDFSDNSLLTFITLPPFPSKQLKPILKYILRKRAGFCFSFLFFSEVMSHNSISQDSSVGVRRAQSSHSCPCVELMVRDKGSGLSVPCQTAHTGVQCLTLHDGRPPPLCSKPSQMTATTLMRRKSHSQQNTKARKALSALTKDLTADLAPQGGATMLCV